MDPPSSTYMSKEAKPSFTGSRDHKNQFPAWVCTAIFWLRHAPIGSAHACPYTHTGPTHLTDSVSGLLCWFRLLRNLTTCINPWDPRRGGRLSSDCHTHAWECTPNVTNVKLLGETRSEGKDSCLTPNPGHTPKEMRTQAFTQQGSPSSQEDRTSSRFTKQTGSQVPE